MENIRSQVIAYLEDAIELRREHHVSFRLELARHERLLPRRLSVRDVDERVVRQDDRHVRLEPERLCLPLLHRARLLQVDRPRRHLPRGVLDAKLEHAVVLTIKKKQNCRVSRIRMDGSRCTEERWMVGWMDGWMDGQRRAPSLAARPSLRRCILQRFQRAPPKSRTPGK
jgi:hypothetical protein